MKEIKFTKIDMSWKEYLDYCNTNQVRVLVRENNGKQFNQDIFFVDLFYGEYSQSYYFSFEGEIRTRTDWDSKWEIYTQIHE